MAVQVPIQGDGRQQSEMGSLADERGIAAVGVLRRVVMWIFARVQQARLGAGVAKQMHLVESLALGNRRQLLLVVCDRHKYLVGTGADSVGCILAIAPAADQVQPLMPGEWGGKLAINRVVEGPTLVPQIGQPGDQQKKTGPGRWQ